ncbi:hypothetical protein SDC9_123486 [bioreactor metagenome]|uniref:Uncharacterized protein n=1 Tax=bioreactor metagenome TaxID=1076179 RepID=A0A645CHU8_9ZZZZ
MQAQSKTFSCGKTVVLGALYDTIEQLKWKLLSANSDAGILMAAERKSDMPFLIRVCPMQKDEVEITVELASGAFSDKDFPEQNAAFLLDALSQVIENALI